MFITRALTPVADPETSERGGPRNMKYKPPHTAAISFGLFLQARGGDGPLGPPGSATDSHTMTPALTISTAETGRKGGVEEGRGGLMRGGLMRGGLMRGG